MKLQVRYFASIREALGSGETIEVDTGCSVAELRDRLIAASPAHAAVLARGRVLRCALNQQLCDESQLVSDGSELAFFPPVTGG